MDEKNLDNAISRLRSQSQPKVPANLEQNVFRRIRQQAEARSEEPQGLIDTVHRFLFISGWMAPAAALAIVFSAFASTVAIAKTESTQEKAAHALGFDAITEAPRLHLDGHRN